MLFTGRKRSKTSHDQNDQQQSRASKKKTAEKAQCIGTSAAAEELCRSDVGHKAVITNQLRKLREISGIFFQLLHNSVLS